MRNSRFGIVADVPWAISKEAGRHILHKSVKNNAVAALAYQGRVCVKFCQHVTVRVHGVKKHQHFVEALSSLLDLRNNAGVNGRTLNHLDVAAQRVCFNGYLVVAADVYVYPYDRASAVSRVHCG